MFVHRSNSLEELVDRLAEILAEQRLGVLTPETILIQSAGMERYISRELARRSGIIANVDFPFPRSFLRGVLDRALGEDDRSSRFERESLTWVIFSELGTSLVEQEAFGPVVSYLIDDGDHSRRLLLAERLAYLFDQYVTYRPRMVLGWQEGALADDFQAILWRRLVERLGNAHFAARCQRFMAELSDEQIQKAVPARISLMGGPGLPPLFLQMMARIGKVVPTHLFSFSVCQEYFADAHPLQDPLPEVGEDLHPLLMSLGKVGADYQHLLEIIGDYEEGIARFSTVEPVSVLSALQRSLVVGSRKLDDAEAVRSRLVQQLQSDESITLDSCHSPLREVEILHDRLLRWFKEDETLRPEDVVVLAPSIEDYSPLISAVFSARAGEHPHIPFRIADRSEKHTNASARAFLLALSLFRSRMKASQLLDLLQLGPVRARYNIESMDLERVTRWIEGAQIRWGIDGAHRATYGLPEDDSNTWRFGLRRLFLGYALFDDGAQLWHGAVPFDGIAASDVELAGRLADFCEGLFELQDRLTRAGDAGLTPSDWRSFLSQLVETILTEEAQAGFDTSAVRSAIFNITERALVILEQQADPGQELHLGLRGMEHLLAAELDASRPSTDFLAGGVTFCALLPLRTIPFRRVCVLGLNQNDFPRADVHHQLDKMPLSPKRGDRSLRADDRYLFLEVLLAAREKLALSYVGHSVQDNTEKPPSVVLSELRLSVEEILQSPGETSTLTYLAPREHPLQPFHPDYYSTRRPDLFSFDEHAFLGAQALTGEAREVAPFFELGDSQGSKSPEEGELNPEEIELTLDRLVSFWKAPTQAFLKERGVVIDDEIARVEDREPVVETGLSRYIAGDRILSQMARGEAVRADVELARGDLPVGQGGRVLLDQVREAAEEIYRASETLRHGNPDAPTSCTFEFESEEGGDFSWWGIETPVRRRIVLTGGIDQMYQAARVEMSYGRLTTGRKIGLWIRHLALCAHGEPRRSVLVVRGNPKETEGVETFELLPLDKEAARRLLARLCRLMTLGLTLPLPFFPTTSEAYFRALSAPPKKLSEEEIVPHAFREARKWILPDRGSFVSEPAVLEVYRGTDPLGDVDLQGRPAVHPSDLSELPFARLAEMMFYPMARATGTWGEG